MASKEQRELSISHCGLSPSLRSWVDNCIVPILVKEFIREKQVAAAKARMAHSATESAAEAEERG